MSSTQSSREAKTIRESSFHPIINESDCDITDDLFDRRNHWSQGAAFRLKLLEDEVSPPPRPMSPVRVPDPENFCEFMLRSPKRDPDNEDIPRSLMQAPEKIPRSPMREPDLESFSEDMPRCESPVVDMEERYLKLTEFLDEIAKKVDQTLFE